MTAVAPTNPIDAIIASAQKPSRNWSKHRKLQRRQERYASMGPNCPNGHPWETTAKFDYRGYRYCIACTEMKAEARRNDPSTYNGKCPKGHAYTRDNTLIVSSQNTKVCLTCKRAASARAGVVDVDLIPRILDLARQGATINALLARGPRKLDKALAPNTVTLTRLTNLKTPEGRELKQLFAQNAKMAHAMRYGVNAWLEAKREFLAAQFEQTRDLEAIATAVNDRFGSHHSATAVAARAYKMGIRLDARRLIKTSVVKVLAPAAVLRFPVGSLLDRINTAVPRHLARDHRDDVIGEMALAVYEGRLDETDISRRVREFVNAGYRRDHDTYGPLSLDVPIFADSATTLGETITTGLWQSESSWQ
jgi:hypothetical protein